MSDRATELLQEFSGSPIDWQSDPANYPFLRIAKIGRSVYSPSGSRIVVGSAMNSATDTAMFFFWKRGDEAAYANFLTNPADLPSEAIATSFFLLDGIPIRRLP